MKNKFKLLGLRRIIFAAVIGLTLVNFVSCSGGRDGEPRPAKPRRMTTKTALQYFTDEKVNMGWNLGNTLDAVRLPNAAAETAMGNPAATQALFKGLKAQGYDIVRIPCTWIGHIGEAPDFIISEERLRRVAEVVNMVHKAGMKAIINIHHDGNFTSPPRTFGFLKFAEMVRGNADNDQIKDQLAKVWTQIAEYFINYGDDLIFETLNEIHSGNWGGNYNPGYPEYSYEREQDLLFEWNQTALDAIRATGGNNAARFVAVPGLGSTEPGIVISAHNRGKLLPDDSENGTSRLIVSVHFYAPSQYTVEERLRHTLTANELAAIDNEARHLKEKFIDNGIAVYYGEWGAPTNTRSRLNTEIQNTHIDYIRRVAAACRANGIVPIIWDDGGWFKIHERSNGRPMPGFWTDVYNVLKTAK